MESLSLGLVLYNLKVGYRVCACWDSILSQGTAGAAGASTGMGGALTMSLEDGDQEESTALTACATEASV